MVEVGSIEIVGRGRSCCGCDRKCSYSHDNPSFALERLLALESDVVAPLHTLQLPGTVVEIPTIVGGEVL